MIYGNLGEGELRWLVWTWFWNGSELCFDGSAGPGKPGRTAETAFVELPAL